jgi:esterase/lipase
MEGQGLAYQVLDDPALMLFFGTVGLGALLVAKIVFKKLNEISSSLEKNKKELNEQFQEFKDGITKLTEVTSDHEKRLRAVEISTAVTNAQAFKAQDMKNLECILRTLPADRIVEGFTAFVATHVESKDREVERVLEEVKYGRRAND